MTDLQTLSKIKMLIAKGQYIFTNKALSEMDMDSLSEDDILESILNAVFVQVKRSTSSHKQARKKSLHYQQSMCQWHRCLHQRNHSETG